MKRRNSQKVTKETKGEVSDKGSDEVLISAEELCELTGYTDRRHRQIAEEGWYPEPVEGHYKRKETLQGLFKYIRSRDHSKDAAAHKTRKLKAEADRVELENEKTRGNLVEAEAVYKHYEKFFVALRQGILGSSLTEEEKDELLNNLRGIKARDLTTDATDGTDKGKD